jgi:hypothetical protein
MKTLISIFSDLSILAATVCAALVFFFSGPVRADADCAATVIPPTMHLKYDQAGRLAQIDDELHRSQLRIFYDKVITTFSETEFKRDIAKPNKWGQTEIWGPRRSMDYMTASGQLSMIHTYEDMKVNSKGAIYGYQTSYNDLENVDWTKLKGADGVTRYTGPAVHETVTYDRTPLGDRTVAVPEPVNFRSAQCYPFEGLSIALHAPAKPKEKTQADDEARATKSGGKSRTITIPEGYITVYDDDDSANQTGQGKNGEQSPQ